MKARTRCIVLFLVLSLTVGLFAGCQKTDNNDNVSSNEKNENGDIVIRVAVQGSAIADLEVLTEAYEETHEGITFKLEEILGDYTTKLLAQVAAKKAPDLIWLSDIQVPGLASKGVLTDLSEYIDINEDEFYESMLDCGKYDGKLYMLSRDYNHVVCYYNKQIFDEAGVAYPQEGWTWEEFEETAEKLAVPSNIAGIYERRGADVNLSWGATAPLIIMGLGGSLTTPYPNGTEANFDTEGTVEALTRIKKLVDSGALRNNYKDDVGAFENGKVGMYFNTRSIMKNITDETTGLGAENIGVVSLPILPVKHYVGAGTSGYAILSSSAYKEEVADFLEFTVSKEGQTVFAKSGNCVPIRKDMIDDPAWIDSVPGIPSEPFVTNFEYDTLQPCLTIENENAVTNFDTSWRNALYGLLNDIKTPEEAAEYGQAEMANILKQ